MGVWKSERQKESHLRKVKKRSSVCLTLAIFNTAYINIVSFDYFFIKDIIDINVTFISGVHHTDLLFVYTAK